MNARRQMWVSVLIALVFALGFLVAGALFPGGPL